MHDLIPACAAIAGGVCGLISIRIKRRRQQQQARHVARLPDHEICDSGVGKKKSRSRCIVNGSSQR